VTRSLAVVLAMALTASSAHGAALTLPPSDIPRALSVGQASVTHEGAFDAEWRVTNEAGDGVVVMTPFHRVVLAARHAAFKGEPLKPSEPAKILKEQRDRLLLFVQLRGHREDFARFYTPRLLLRGAAASQEIEPTFVQNERSAVRQESGEFLARCVYGFPTKELTGTSRVQLVVRDAERRDVSRFTIDLGAMR
jgi:hypothetical protein